VMMVAQDGTAMDVVVDDQAELTAGFERHRHDVHALIGQKATDTRKRAGAVRETKRELSSNRHRGKG